MRRPEKCPQCGAGSVAEIEEQRWDEDADERLDDNGDDNGAAPAAPPRQEQQPDVPFTMRRVRWTCQNCGWTDNGFSVKKPEEGPANQR
jgi:ribosomal protein S27AE